MANRARPIKQPKNEAAQQQTAQPGQQPPKSTTPEQRVSAPHENRLPSGFQELPATTADKTEGGRTHDSSKESQARAPEAGGMPPGQHRKRGG